jgi:hypothetical protein
MTATEQALEARARRAARRLGLVARKTRWRAGTIDNYCSFTFEPGLEDDLLAGRAGPAAYIEAHT